jgi:release factor glutamine methyltransferase
MMPGGQTIAQALRQAKAMGADRLDAQMLLAHILERPRSWLIAHDDAVLTPGQIDALNAALQRRADGEPTAYLVGEKEFHGLCLRVDANVLVPRPDTEVLVDWACELLGRGFPDAPSPRVVDLGTGSGAISLAIKHARPESVVLATDVSEAAIEVARTNAMRLGMSIELLETNWWKGLEGRRFELVVSNPPYIAGGDPHLAALRHEPTLALTPGGDGLAALRELIAGAPAHMVAQGWLLLEHGYDQAAAVRAMLHDHGFRRIETRRDLGGQERCTGATR